MELLVPAMDGLVTRNIFVFEKKKKAKYLAKCYTLEMNTEHLHPCDCMH